MGGVDIDCPKDGIHKRGYQELFREKEKRGMKINKLPLASFLIVDGVFTLYFLQKIHLRVL